MRLLGLLIGAALLASCDLPAAPTTWPAADPAPEPPHVQVLSPSAAQARAQAHGLHAEPMWLPTEEGAVVDTEVPRLMAEVERRGARLVSGIALVMPEVHEGQPVSCVTEVVPRAQLEEFVEPVEVPGHTETVAVREPTTRYETRLVRECKSRMRPVTRTQHTMERECHTESRAHQRPRTVYEHQYDYRTHTSRSVPRTHYETVFENEHVCRMVPKTKMVTEHDFVYDCDLVTKSEMVHDHRWVTRDRFVPPRTEWVERSDWRWRAAVSPRVCSPPTDVVSARKGGSIEATMWLPGPAPAADLVEPFAAPAPAPLTPN